MNNFNDIWARAAKHLGNSSALQASLPAVIDPQALTSKPDREFLSSMSRCVFQAGFAWHVVDAMWPGFEQAFHAFEPTWLRNLDDEAWNAYKTDRRIVRNGPKILSVRDNARMVSALADEARGFGNFLAAWPSDDLVGLLRVLKQRGSRLGGNTGARFLKAVGKDCFTLDGAVIAGLQQEGVKIASPPTSTRDLASVQAAFNRWHDESGLAYQHLSLIVAASSGHALEPTHRPGRTG